MAISPDVLALIRAEHERAPVTGDVVTIGRQSMDDGTTDRQLFDELGAATLMAMDVSDYEGATIIHDLNNPLPVALHNICDFLFDGSCLDNLFDPANAMRSFAKMLRPGGRMMLVEHGTAIQGALICFSPEWFYDFFAANGYELHGITLLPFPAGRWEPKQWVPYEGGKPVTASPGTEIGDFYTVVIAEKRAESTDGRALIQAQYRVLHGGG